ncbi:MAG: hypothetical protein ACRETP_02945 [Steroidobacteraceae bacterium]
MRASLIDADDARGVLMEKLMGSMSSLFGDGPRPTSTELIQTHRARLALEEEESAQQRRLELAEQRSDRNPPHVRIRIWEKLHGLRLPSDAAHPILDVIAIGTRLTLAEVREEQRARQARRTLPAS